jgi:hypothetical protein
VYEPAQEGRVAIDALRAGLTAAAAAAAAAAAYIPTVGRSSGLLKQHTYSIKFCLAAVNSACL